MLFSTQALLPVFGIEHMMKVKIKDWISLVISFGFL